MPTRRTHEQRSKRSSHLQQLADHAAAPHGHPALPRHEFRILTDRAGCIRAVEFARSHQPRAQYRVAPNSTQPVRGLALDTAQLAAMIDQHPGPIATGYYAVDGAFSRRPELADRAAVRTTLRRQPEGRRGRLYPGEADALIDESLSLYAAMVNSYLASVDARVDAYVDARVDHDVTDDAMREADDQAIDREPMVVRAHARAHVRDAVVALTATAYFAAVDLVTVACRNSALIDTDDASAVSCRTTVFLTTAAGAAAVGCAGVTLGQHFARLTY